MTVNGQPSVNEMRIYSGDTIVTDSSGQAAVKFLRGGLSELDVNTNAIVKDVSDPSFSQRLWVYFGCMTDIVFSSGQAFWEGGGQRSCFHHGQYELIPLSQFNLQLSSGRDVLTVAEGQVSVAGTQSVIVPAGTQVSLADGRVIEQRQVSPEELSRITAWRWRSTFRLYTPPHFSVRHRTGHRRVLGSANAAPHTWAIIEVRHRAPVVGLYRGCVANQRLRCKFGPIRTTMDQLGGFGPQGHPTDGGGTAR